MEKLRLTPRNQAMAATAVLVLYGNLVNLMPQHLHDQVYVPLNLAAVLALTAWARRYSLSWETMGFYPIRAASALRWGIGAGILIPAALLLAFVLPVPIDSLSRSRELDSADGLDLAYQTLLRIPLGTALFEEAAFRGVLLGLWLRTSSVRGAVVAQSVGFGLWHVTPTLELLRGSDLSTNPAFLAFGVMGGVAATFAGGLFFGWIRQRSGSIYGPVLAHWLINALTAALAFLMVR